MNIKDFRLCKSMLEFNACQLVKLVFTFDIPDCIILQITKGSLNNAHDTCEFDKIIDKIYVKHKFLFIYFSEINVFYTVES